MKLAFCADNRPYARFIRFIDGGQFNHVGIVCTNSLGDRVVEAVDKCGVRNRRLDSFLADHDRTEIVEFAVPHEDLLFPFLLKQTGKSYDFVALLGRLFNQKWSSGDKWICSSLALATMKIGGAEFTEPPNGYGVNGVYTLAKQLSIK